ncbi:MAG: BON domain-containing protein [Blastocatellia bacterium]
MASEGIFCSGCGITLRPFMRVCPRCGAARETAAAMQAPSSADSEADLFSIETPVAPEHFPARDSVDEPTPAFAGDRETKTEVVPFDVVRQQRHRPNEEYFAPPQDLVFLSPSDMRRRFPLFTSSQLALIAIGAGLLILMIVIAYLLWRQQQRDLSAGANNAGAVALPAPIATPTSDTSPTPTPTPVDDQSISEAVKLALTAYNPLGFTRYKFEVKEGVVTINGEADHQPEKDGVDNVLKLIIGVKSVVNNLTVRPEPPFSPVKLNTAEAKILDDAMRRQLEAGGQTASVDQPKQPSQTEAQREAAARAAKQREEEAALRKAAEEKLRREAEEYEKRQEELRRAEAERRARAEQARLDASVLRSGTVAWSGVVDGVDEVVISGSSASVRHVNGNPPREVKASFSAPIPRSPVKVTLISANGRGPISVVQQPSAANGYATIVRIDDSDKGGDKRYEFTLRWSAQ